MCFTRAVDVNLSLCLVHHFPLVLVITVLPYIRMWAHLSLIRMDVLCNPVAFVFMVGPQLTP